MNLKKGESEAIGKSRPFVGYKTNCIQENPIALMHLSRNTSHTSFAAAKHRDAAMNALTQTH
jgi:hypothetical protein